MLILTRRKSKRLDDFFERAWPGIGTHIRIRFAPVRIPAFLDHVPLDAHPPEGEELRIGLVLNLAHRAGAVMKLCAFRAGGILAA